MQSNKKSIFLKAKYLLQEFREVEEKFNDYCAGFFSEVNKVQNLNTPVKSEDIGNDLAKTESSKHTKDAEARSDSDHNHGELDAPDVSDKLKKLYKKIALITHPDRHPEYLSESKRKEMIDIYNRSSNAIRENDLFSLLDAASELYLDLPKLEKKDLKNIKRKCLDLESGIEEMKNTYPWIWGEQIDSDKKEYIINLFIESRHKV